MRKCVLWELMLGMGKSTRFVVESLGKLFRHRWNSNTSFAIFDILARKFVEISSLKFSLQFHIFWCLLCCCQFLTYSSFSRFHFFHSKHARLNDIASISIKRKLFAFLLSILHKLQQEVKNARTFYCQWWCLDFWKATLLAWNACGGRNPRSKKKRISLNRRAINSRHFPTSKKMTKRKKVHKNRELCDWHEASNYIVTNLISLGIIALKWCLLESQRRYFVRDFNRLAAVIRWWDFLLHLVQISLMII